MFKGKFCPHVSDLKVNTPLAESWTLTFSVQAPKGDHPLFPGPSFACFSACVTVASLQLARTTVIALRVDSALRWVVAISYNLLTTIRLVKSRPKGR